MTQKITVTVPKLRKSLMREAAECMKNLEVCVCVWGGRNFEVYMFVCACMCVGGGEGGGRGEGSLEPYSWNPPHPTAPKA